MNPTELVSPRCKLTGTVPVLRSTSHYFLDLPGLTPPLQRYITQASQQGGWSANCVQVPATPADLHVCGLPCPSACAPLRKNSCPHVCLAASPPLLPRFPGWQSYRHGSLWRAPQARSHASARPAIQLKLMP